MVEKVEKVTVTDGATQQATGTGAAAPAKPDKKAMTKVEAVRRSIEKLGVEATNSEIQADVQKRFKIEMSTNHISTYKGDFLRKAKAEAGGAEEAAAPVSHQQEAKPAVKREQPATPKAAPAAAKNGKGTAVELNDILAVKKLVERVGAEHLRTLIGVLEK